MKKRNKKLLQSRKISPKKKKPDSESKRTKRPSRSPRRDKLGRFVSARRKSKKPVKRSRNEKTKSPAKNRARSPKKSAPNRRRTKPTLRRLSNSARRKSKTAKLAASRASLPFLDGRRVIGRDSAFKRKVTISDQAKNIVIANYSRAAEIGLTPGSEIEIQKRNIDLATPTKHKGRGIQDWNYDAAINSKFSQMFNAEGPGLYFFKARFLRPVDGELYPKWISTKRRYIATIQDLKDEFYNFNTMLEVSRESNIYGFQQNGYGLDGIEIERIADRKIYSDAAAESEN